MINPFTGTLWMGWSWSWGSMAMCKTAKHDRSRQDLDLPPFAAWSLGRTVEQILQLQLVVWVSTLFKIRPITPIIFRHHLKLKPPQPRPHFKLHTKPSSVPTYLPTSLDLLLTVDLEKIAWQCFPDWREYIEIWVDSIKQPFILP